MSIGLRSGGHSWVGNAVRDDGPLLDLLQLKGIEVDPEARTTTIEPGVRVRDLEQVLTPQGLYFPVGHCPTVGITGYILGGGAGLNSREGPAARGSGPGFSGVVTRLAATVTELLSRTGRWWSDSSATDRRTTA